MKNVEYISNLSGGKDSRGHPIHYLKFIMDDGSIKEKGITSSGTGGRYALQDFMKKVKKVFTGRDGFSNANIKLSEESDGDIYYHQWFSVLKRDENE